MPMEAHEFISKKGFGLISSYMTQQGDLHGSIAASGAILHGYPQSVVRGEEMLRRLGEQQFEIWEEEILYFDPALEDAQEIKRMWSREREKARRLFATGFVEAYQKHIRPEDERQKRNQEHEERMQKLNKEPYEYETDRPLIRQKIMNEGSSVARNEAGALYPQVFRTRAEIEQLGQTLCGKQLARYDYKPNYTDDKEEFTHLFVSGFVPAYEQEVAEKDKQAGIKPQPTTSTTQGATLTLKQVERKANEYVYHIELTDPGHIDGVQTAEVVYPLGEVEPAQAFASAGYAVSASDSTPSYKVIVPLPTSQQQKGARLYVRNVKKK